MADAFDPIELLAQKALVVRRICDRDLDEVVLITGHQMRLEHPRHTRQRA